MIFNELGSLSIDLKKEGDRELLKVYYWVWGEEKKDITYLVNEFFSSAEIKTIKGEKYILNASGMGISVYQCLKTKIELEGNILAHKVKEILKREESET